MPTAEYVLRASVDLSPVHERLTITKKVRIEQPPADILDRCIAQLASKDVSVRRAAALELFWFPEEGEKAGPALLAAVKDPDTDVRSTAIECLSRFPKHASAHADVFLAIARGGEGITQWERVAAAWLLARTAPQNRDVEKLLMSLVLSEDEFLKKSCAHTLQVYESRLAREKPAEDPR